MNGREKEGGGGVRNRRWEERKYESPPVIEATEGVTALGEALNSWKYISYISQIIMKLIVFQ